MLPSSVPYAAPESIEERRPMSRARAVPLKPPMGSRRPSRAAAGSVVGRPSRSRAQPGGEVQPLLAVDAHLAVGGGAEGGVVDDGQLLSGGDGHGQGVDPQQALRAPPGGHRGQGVGGGQADHVRREGLHGVVGHRPAVVAPRARRRSPSREHARCRCPRRPRSPGAWRSGRRSAPCCSRRRPPGRPPPGAPPPGAPGGRRPPGRACARTPGRAARRASAPPGGRP